MAEIIPAVIGRNFKEVLSKILSVEGLVNWVQVDVTDGLFAPDETWSAPQDLAVVPGKTKIEAHLMIERPEQVIADWQKVVDRVIVHYESTGELETILKSFQSSPVKLGLALLLETPLAKLEPFISQVKHIQLMSIAAIGHHGEPLAPLVLEKIATLRAAHPDVTISVDGGISLENAPELIAAGADNLVVGSAIWQSGDIPGAIKKFQALLS